MGRVRLIEQEIFLFSPEETRRFGRDFANKLAPNSILALYGPLGAGKTTFVQGLAEGLGIEAAVQSPTFTLFHLYEGSLSLYHFDLYRFKNAEDFFQMGFEEYFEKGGICAIEWPERLGPRLPQNAISLSFQHLETGGRRAIWNFPQEAGRV